MCTLTYEFSLEINPIFAIIRSLFLTGDWERGRRLRHGGDAAAPARVPRQARGADRGQAALHLRHGRPLRQQLPAG